jgi:Antibiotic biosynthesis monooxygenase
MRYTRLSTYDLTKGDFNELTGIAEKGILPTFAKEPGFVNYGLVNAGDHKVVSISIWETREAAQKSEGMAASWIKENIGDRVRLVTSYVGDLALFRGLPVTA